MPVSRFELRSPALLAGIAWLVIAVLLAVALPLRAQPASPGSGGVNRAELREKPYVILISLDGFRADHLDVYDLPHLRRVAARGARARWMQAVFPSLTFPNHFSLVTGLESARHGIVSNRFYDPQRKQHYVYTDNASVTDGSWYAGEPIWVTAERQGMVAACYFWPGSEAVINGLRPSIYTKYSSEVPNEDRVATVLEWLRMPADRRPHLITLYFSELDSAQHAGPVDAPAVKEAALSIDRAVGALMDGIDALPHGKQVYVLITSDHGMIETTQTQAIQLASLLDPADLADLEASFAGPVANLHVRGSAERIRQMRDTLAARLPRGDVYLRENLPERFRHRSNPRSGDIIVVMDEGWTMSVPRATAAESPRAATDKPAAPRSPRPDSWGGHGWDPYFPSMRAFFMAVGPTIPAGTLIGPVRNIDVYPLMTELLGLKPADDIDGTRGAIRSQFELAPAQRGR